MIDVIAMFFFIFKSYFNQLLLPVYQNQESICSLQESQHLEYHEFAPLFLLVPALPYSI